MINSKEYNGGLNGIPQFEDRKKMWKTLEISEFKTSLPLLNEYLNELSNLYVNGSVIHKSFILGESEVLDWYVSRNQLKEMLFFWKLWEHKELIKYLDLTEIDEDSNQSFESSSPFMLGGSLAWALNWGGAYREPTWKGSRSKELGENAAGELLDGNFDNCLVFEARGAWCNFFYDVAWDYTWVILNKEKRLLHVIMATDTD